MANAITAIHKPTGREVKILSKNEKTFTVEVIFKDHLFKTDLPRGSVKEIAIRTNGEN